MVKFVLELDALDVPVLLRIILDRAVGAKLAHLVIIEYSDKPFCQRTKHVCNGRNVPWLSSGCSS